MLLYDPAGTEASIVAAYSTVVNPFPASREFAIGPVESDARVTEVVLVGQAYFAPAPPPVAPVPHVPEEISSPQGCSPNHGVPAVIKPGVVELFIQNPFSGFISCPLEVAVRLYPFKPFVLMLIN